MLQMRSVEHTQDHDEGRGVDAPAPGPDGDIDRPTPSATVDVRPVNANGRRLSRAEERHLREWAGTLVRGRYDDFCCVCDACCHAPFAVRAERGHGSRTCTQSCRPCPNNFCRKWRSRPRLLCASTFRLAQSRPKWRFLWRSVVHSCHSSPPHSLLQPVSAI